MMFLKALLSFALLTALPAFALANPNVHMPNTPCGSNCTLQITAYASDNQETTNIFRINQVSVTSSRSKVPYYDLYSPQKSLVDACATQLKSLPQAGKMVVVQASEYKLANSNRVVFKFNNGCETKNRGNIGIAGPGKKGQLTKPGAKKNILKKGPKKGK